MQSRYVHLLRLMTCTSFLTMLLSPSAAPAELCEQSVAQVVSVQGTVEVQRVSGTQWHAVQ